MSVKEERERREQREEDPLVGAAAKLPGYFEQAYRAALLPFERCARARVCVSLVRYTSGDQYNRSMGVAL